MEQRHTLARLLFFSLFITSTSINIVDCRLVQKVVSKSRGSTLIYIQRKKERKNTALTLSTV